MPRFEDFHLRIKRVDPDIMGETGDLFMAFLDEIPEGAFHAFGKTQEEAISILRESLPGFLSTLEELKQPLPEPRIDPEEEECSGRITLRMPRSLHSQLIRHAEKEDVSLNSYIVHILSQAAAGSDVAKIALRNMASLRKARKEAQTIPKKNTFTRSDIKVTSDKTEVSSNLGVSSPDGVSFILDGITMQHAAELMLDTESTTAHRAACAETYLSSLESLIFAYFFGNNFVHVGSYPDLRVAPSPANILCANLPIERQIVVKKPEDTPESMLHDEKIRNDIGEDFKHLERAYKSDTIYWRHWIIRETQVYFGDNDSLFKTHDDPSEYIYGRPIPYLIDRKLQDSIPTHLIHDLSIVARNALADLQNIPVEEVYDAAFEEFISRNILTHQMLFWWYGKVSEINISNNTYNIVHIPHLTRRSIRVSRYSTEIEYGFNLLRIYLKSALGYILHLPIVRSELVKVLDPIRELPQFATLRKMIMEIYQTPIEKRELKVIAFNEYINKLFIEGTLWTEMGIDTTPTYNGSLIALSKLLNSSTARYYFVNIFRTFPELKLS